MLRVATVALFLVTKSLKLAIFFTHLTLPSGRQLSGNDVPKGEFAFAVGANIESFLSFFDSRGQRFKQACLYACLTTMAKVICFTVWDVVS